MEHCFLYFVLLIGSGTLINYCYRKAGTYQEGSFLFNFLYCLFCVGCCAVEVIVARESISLVTIVWGTVTGGALALAANLYIRALSCGPLALSSALFGISNLFAVAYCAVYPGESLTVVQVVGYLFLLVSGFVTMQEGKNSESTKKNGNDAEDSAVSKAEKRVVDSSRRWVILIVSAVFVNSLIPYAIRIQAQKTDGGEAGFMLLCYLGTACICNLYFAGKNGCFRTDVFGRMRKILLLACVMAAAMCINTWVQSQMGAMHMPAVIQYPVTNVGVMLAMIVTGRIFYGEKISKRSAGSLAVCVLASILICL